MARPKYKVGDFITINGELFVITFCDEETQAYDMRECTDYGMSMPIDEVDQEAHKV